VKAFVIKRTGSQRGSGRLAPGSIYTNHDRNDLKETGQIWRISPT
jgi:hypothetical protein